MNNTIYRPFKTNCIDLQRIKNMNKSEKLVSIGAGAFILIKGLTNIKSNPLLAVAELAVGGGLMARGLSGYCPLKEIIENNNLQTGYMKEALSEENTTPLGI